MSENVMIAELRRCDTRALCREIESIYDAWSDYQDLIFLADYDPALERTVRDLTFTVREDLEETLEAAEDVWADRVSYLERTKRVREVDLVDVPVPGLSE